MDQHALGVDSHFFLASPHHENKPVAVSCLSLACSSSGKHALVVSWLKGDVLGEKLVTLADHLCTKDLESTVTSKPYFSERWTLLSLVLSQHVEHDYLIGDVYVERVLVKLNETLSKVKKFSEAENNDSSVSLICNVAYDCFSSATGCLLMPSSEDLLSTLFQLCAQSNEETHLPDVLICKLKKTWLFGMDPLSVRLAAQVGRALFCICRRCG
uniref:E3 ubiquitin-protein ligase listerin n=1 Tax=Molossus molossus TaxID=27622 RepID=A0A7J8HIA3_MOLMO|nr:hypothetical protein HJG59_011027 [Molossus molossus]